MRKCSPGVGGFIRDYIEYTGGLESPWEFHMWSAISIIGQTLGRKCYLDMSYFNVYPNLYVVLTGPSGIKKSTAAGFAVKLFRDAHKYNERIIEGKITMPAMFKEMNQQYLASGESKILIYASEFKVFTDVNTSATSLLGDMTHLWDCPDTFSSKLKTEGTTNMDNVFVGMLACSTPEWLTSCSCKDFLGSGFAARILFVCKDQCEKRFHRPFKPANWQNLHNNLVSDLQDIAKLKHSYDYSKEANDFMEKWYNDHENNFKHADERFAEFLNRKQIHAIKLAMISRAATDDSNVIQVEDVKWAVQVLDMMQADLPIAYSAWSHNEAAALVDRITTLLNRNGKRMTVRSIMRSCRSRWPQTKVIFDALDFMEQSGIVHRECGKGNREADVRWIILNDGAES